MTTFMIFFFSYIIWWQSSINCVYILTIKQQLWNEIRLILTTITWYIYNLLGNPNSTWYIGDNQTILIFVINNLCHFFCYNINQTNKRTEELQSMEKCYFQNVTSKTFFLLSFDSNYICYNRSLWQSKHITHKRHFFRMSFHVCWKMQL